MVFQRLLGPNGRLPILIRDDDTNFFTRTSMLESVYSKAFENGFKVGLSVVPFQKGTDDISVPPNMRTKDLNFSVSDNEGLVRFLKNKIRDRTIEVLQHGFSHDITNGGRGEFGNDLDKRKEIELGRNILKQALEVNPKFFVPPGEDISNRTLRTLVELGLVPIYRQSFFDSFLRNSFVPANVKQIAMRGIIAKYRNRSRDSNWYIQFVKPVFISVGKRVITWSLASMEYAKISSLDNLFKLTTQIIESSSISRNPVCILNHYHIYYHDWNTSITRKDLFQAWTQILKSFDRIQFGWKVSFSELYERENQIQGVNIVKTGSKITLESKKRVLNFSFRTRHNLETSSSFLFDAENKIVTIEDLLPERKTILYEKS